MPTTISPRRRPWYFRLLSWVLWRMGVLAVLMLLVFWFRAPMASGLGAYLMPEDSLRAAPVGFVLSGGALERASRAAELDTTRLVAKWVCTGALPDPIATALGYQGTEATLSQLVMHRRGVDSARVSVLPVGTSTQEECAAIVAYCHQRGYRSAVVVSHRMHLRRIRGALARALRAHKPDYQIDFILIGAPSATFKESEWWQSEYGLIFVQNEYVKLAYYWLKY